MNVNNYVNKIVRKIKCSSARRKEIRKQLQMDIELRIQQGESLEQVMSQMGDIREIADSFNENISAVEKKKYTLKKILTIVAVVVVFLALIAIGIYRALPKSVAIEDSTYFDKQTVTEAVERAIILLDDEDYAKLQEEAIQQMQSVLNQATIDQARAQVTSDWGERQSIGTTYATEVIQNGEHYAIAQVTVSYENVNVVYTLTYDADMKLAGLYMR